MTEARKWTTLREELLRRGWKPASSIDEDPEALTSHHDAISVGRSPDAEDWVTPLRTALERRCQTMRFYASEGFEPDGSRGTLADVEELLRVLDELFAER